MTENEKSQNGLLFNTRDEAFQSLKRETHELCRIYNNLSETDPKRNEIIKKMLGSVGEGFYLRAPIQFNFGKHTFVGKNFFSNFNFVCLDDTKVVIGDNALIASNVSIQAARHPLIADERMRFEFENGEKNVAEWGTGIVIGNDVWICSNVVIIDGVHIGDRCVIGAGSVVTRDMPADYVCYGNPCKPVRKITEADSIYKLGIIE